METLDVGVVVHARYELVSFLGEGGMGVVWSARHLVTGKGVALKILKGESLEQRKRFVREARVAAAIQHPNVVAIHDVLVLDDGRPVLVMDLLEGEPLSAALERSTRLDPSELATIMLPTLAAVGAAHAAGVIHRDLKPENVFLAKASSHGTVTVKVLDFGIAKLTALSSAIHHSAALTQTGSVLGTPLYMAPEQVFGEKSIDHRADIWSLGVMMYECLSGACPIEGDNVGQIFKSISQRSFAPIRRAVPSISPGLADLIESMLSLAPEERPDSAREVARVLAFETGFEAPEVDEPLWAPSSQRRQRPSTDPSAPTEAMPALKVSAQGRRRWLFAAIALGVLAAMGWQILKAKSGSAPPVASAATATVEERPDLETISAAETPRASPAVDTAMPIEPPITATKAKLSNGVTALPTVRPTATPESTAGPGGIHAVSPY